MYVDFLSNSESEGKQNQLLTTCITCTWDFLWFLPRTHQGIIAQVIIWFSATPKCPWGDPWWFELGFDHLASERHCSSFFMEGFFQGKEALHTGPNGLFQFVIWRYLKFQRWVQHNFLPCPTLLIIKLSLPSETSNFRKNQTKDDGQLVGWTSIQWKVQREIHWIKWLPPVWEET